MDKLLLIGINHKVASAALRERLAFNTEGVIQTAETLRPRLDKDDEVALLSTCNRTEVIMRVANSCRAEDVVCEFLSEAGNMHPATLADMLYTHRHRKAARHLLTVAAGLDSLVIGENEIQGQVRTACELAATAGTCGPYLNALFRVAVQCGKRVRAETEIGKTKLSVATLVVELATEQLGDLQQHTALLIGAGKISSLTARELVRAGLRCVLVSNRTYKRAQKLAQNLGAHYASAVHFDQLDKKLTNADIVICSTSAPHIVLHEAAVVSAMQTRPYRPMLVVDLAIPRDADPVISGIPNVALYAIDDLSGLVQERHPLTTEAWQEAKTIVAEELSFFNDWCDARRVAPLIRSLRAKADAIVRAEIERTLRHMGPLSPEERAAVEHMGKAIVNKLLHEPTLCLKKQPEALQDHDIREFVRALFGLEQV